MTLLFHRSPYKVGYADGLRDAASRQSRSKALLGKRITATEVAQFRRPTGDNAQPFDYDLAGLKRYCDSMGYEMPSLPNNSITGGGTPYRECTGSSSTGGER